MLKDTEHVSYRIPIFKTKKEIEEDGDHHIMKVKINKKVFYNQREWYILNDNPRLLSSNQHVLESLKGPFL